MVTSTVQVGDSVNPDLAGDLMVTTTPILNIDRLPDYQYAGLPLGQSASDAWWIMFIVYDPGPVAGIYTNYYGKGCQRTSRGTVGKDCKKMSPQHQRVDYQVISTALGHLKPCHGSILSISNIHDLGIAKWY